MDKSRSGLETATHDSGPDGSVDISDAEVQAGLVQQIEGLLTQIDTGFDEARKLAQESGRPEAVEALAAIEERFNRIKNELAALGAIKKSDTDAVTDEGEGNVVAWKPRGSEDFGTGNSEKRSDKKRASKLRRVGAGALLVATAAGVANAAASAAQTHEAAPHASVSVSNTVDVSGRADAHRIQINEDRTSNEQERQNFELKYFAYEHGKTHKHDMGPAYTGKHTKEAFTAEALRLAAHDPNMMATFMQSCGIEQGDIARMNACGEKYTDTGARQSGYEQLKSFFAKDNVTVEFVKITTGYNSIWSDTDGKSRGERPDIVMAHNVHNGGHAAIVRLDGRTIAEYRLECGLQWMLPQEVAQQMHSEHSDVREIPAEHVAQRTTVTHKVNHVTVTVEGSHTNKTTTPVNIPKIPTTPVTPVTPSVPETPVTPEKPPTPTTHLEAKDGTKDAEVNPEVKEQKKMADERVDSGGRNDSTSPEDVYTPPNTSASTSPDATPKATQGSQTAVDNSENHASSGDLKVSHEAAGGNASSNTVANDSDNRASGVSDNIYGQ